MGPPLTGTIAVKLNGRRRANSSRTIRSDIAEALSQKPCAVLACNPSTKCAVDHKNGRYEDDTVNNLNAQSESQFQPLHPVVNTAKREHCKACRQNNQRFDAKILGYVKGWIRGDGQWAGNCLGCYWHDPVEFNKKISVSSLSPASTAT